MVEMKFTPDPDDGPTISVPYLDEARAAEGWVGISTSLSYDRLKSDVTNALAKLGGVVHSFQRGSFEIEGLERAACIINYSIEGPKGKMVYGRIDIAALPVKKPASNRNYNKVLKNRHETSIRVALFNVANILRGQWVLKQLNPTYVPLIPWMITANDKTLNEAWLEAGMTPQLAPPKDSKFEADDDTVEGDFKEIK